MVTAPSHRQVEKALWAEVRSYYFKAKAKGIDLGGDLKPTATEWNIDEGWYALGFATDDPDKIHGFHGQKVLVIVDECQGMNTKTLEAIENVMSDGNAHLLLLQNPSILNGEAYDSFHKKASLYNKISISAYDTPNLMYGKNTIKGLTDPDQVAEWLQVYGPKSNFCMIKVFASFPKQEDDSLVSLDWIEAAHKRKPKTTTNTKRRGTGVDPARYGPDDSIIQPFSGRHLYAPVKHNGMDTMEITGRNKIALAAIEARFSVIDVIGIGSGVVDRTRELKSPRISVIGVNVAANARNKKKFENLRSELLWQFREALNPKHPDPISMVECAERTEELTAYKYRINSKGLIEVISKDKVKSTLNRSPGASDAGYLAVEGMRYTSFIDAEEAEDAEPQEVRTSGLEHDDEVGFEHDGSSQASAGFED